MRPKTISVEWQIRAWHTAAAEAEAVLGSEASDEENEKSGEFRVSKFNEPARIFNYDFILDANALATREGCRPRHFHA